MNIDGIRILSQQVIMENPNFVFMVYVLLAGCSILFLIGALITCKDWQIIVSVISGFVFMLWLIFAGACGIFEKPSDRNIYKCLFEDDIPIQELYDKYEIIDKDGDIWILEDKK